MVLYASIVFMTVLVSK